MNGQISRGFQTGYAYGGGRFSSVGEALANFMQMALASSQLNRQYGMQQRLQSQQEQSGMERAKIGAGWLPGAGGQLNPPTTQNLTEAINQLAGLGRGGKVTHKVGDSTLSVDLQTPQQMLEAPYEIFKKIAGKTPGEFLTSGPKGYIKSLFGYQPSETDISNIMQQYGIKPAEMGAGKKATGVIDTTGVGVDKWEQYRSQLQPGEILIQRGNQIIAITVDEFQPNDIKL